MKTAFRSEKKPSIAALAVAHDYGFEANAMAVRVFRNGFLEELHDGRDSDLLNDSTLCRLTDEEMRILMTECGRKLARHLQLRDTDRPAYDRLIADVIDCYHHNRRPKDQPPRTPRRRSTEKTQSGEGQETPAHLASHPPRSKTLCGSS